MTTDFILPPPAQPVPVRERARRWQKRQQLKVWLPAMAAVEWLGATESPIYYWLVQRAIRANSWRWEGQS